LIKPEASKTLLKIRSEASMLKIVDFLNSYSQFFSL